MLERYEMVYGFVGSGRNCHCSICTPFGKLDPGSQYTRLHFLWSFAGTFLGGILHPTCGRHSYFLVGSGGTVFGCYPLQQPDYFILVVSTDRLFHVRWVEPDFADGYRKQQETD